MQTSGDVEVVAVVEGQDHLHGQRAAALAFQALPGRHGRVGRRVVSCINGVMHIEGN